MYRHLIINHKFKKTMSNQEIIDILNEVLANHYNNSYNYVEFMCNALSYHTDTSHQKAKIIAELWKDRDKTVMYEVDREGKTIEKDVKKIESDEPYGGAWYYTGDKPSRVANIERTIERLEKSL